MIGTLSRIRTGIARLRRSAVVQLTYKDFVAPHIGYGFGRLYLEPPTRFEPALQDLGGPPLSS